MKKFNRRDFIKFSGLLVVGNFFTGCNEIYRATSNSLNDIEKNFTEDLSTNFLRQIITADSSNSRCIMWQVNSEMNAPEVEIKNKSGEVVKIPAEKNFFIDDGSENLQYIANIKNLTPATEYEYRIIDGENCTKYFNLKTSANKKFKAVIFPDSQSADYKVWGNVAKVAFEKNPDAEFFVNVGDIVDNGEDRTQWQAWMNEVDEQLKKIPFVPVLGNHETYNREWKVRLPVAYLNYFAVPDNGSKNFSRHFYSFDFGNAHFVVLDSQWNSTDKTWKIIFIHKDVLQYRINGRPERLEGFSDVGEIFMPEFERLGADVVFTAHLHTYRNRGRLKKFQADETGPLYILTGLSGDVRYPGLWIDHKLDKVTAPQPETDNFLTLEVDEKILTVKCFLPSGEKIDEYILKKD